MKSIGDWGEEKASVFLQNLGYQILERNFRFRRGEIDIIAQHEGTIVFVEVKTRNSTRYGMPEQSVSPNQEEWIQLVAEEYLQQKQLDCAIRFDIIAILKRGKQYKLEHLEDAF